MPHWSHPSTPVDHSKMKLGKKPPKTDSRRLMLRNYLAAGWLPDPPLNWGWGLGRVDWGMMGNDELGDCTIAAVGHALQVVSLNVDTEISLTTEQAVDYYAKWDGYVPGDPSTDNGGVIIDVLNQWKKDKLIGHQLMAYADPDPQNVDHVKRSIAYFGGINIGLALPISAQSQVVWDVRGSSIDPNNAPNSWGGHCVWVYGYDPHGLWCITWGGIKYMTWAFWDRYCDESHTCVLGYWFRKGAAPSGVIVDSSGENVRINEMVADAAALSQ